ncbi:tripartite tricarboxylate transporter substrate binding protein [Roseicyclus sp. F158]|uniref:Tripartite tricarboxylate transporter substrate binding protein n=1 Tax=Tropicimonas omnivorans TaxID=3075590 RepID=A0ABU3DE59_9RHOB|nr:tripartite tricarboxylate transporter substrate binding protein [Roseicyclus sp. F158]MDT0682011.1 tripartite tricarboxylate transporter substrate binding protein [Roseicyclus sp. F158]
MKSSLALVPALVASSIIHPVAAQDYPASSVDVVIPSSPGSGVDILGRAFLEQLGEELGTSFVPLNRPGAANSIGVTLVGNAKADGRTLGLTAAGPFVSQLHMQDLAYEFDDFTYICQVFEVPVVFAVQEDSPHNSLDDIVQASKGGERILVSSAGVATIPHVALSELASQTGTEFTHAPYNGDAAALQAVLGGEVVMGGLGLGTTVNQPVKIIGLFTRDRISQLPDMPTATEAGYEIVKTGSAGLFAPADIPEEERQMLETACEAVVTGAEFSDFATSLNQAPNFLNSADWLSRLEADSASNKTVIDENGLGMR